ncbi:alpha/beta hydrolase [Nemorincola caseinilytica]|uniref:Alpha/beta hydrolase n=1 Tax=Nemorincola caseinilytica TaxID=2054315 RepID=A0ABP8N7G6_9BACT
MMYYRRTGSGPAVVLLHGFPDSGEAWTGVASALEREFTVIIPDLPGSGRSALHGTPTLTDMAVGVKEILDHEGIERAVIAGHSMGGYTAMAFAAQFPAMLAGISMVHSAPWADDDEKKASRQKVIDLILKGGKETFIKQMTANLYAPSFAAAHPDVVQRKAASGMEMTDEGMINFYRAMIARADTTHLLKDAPFPIQWVLGEADGIIDLKKILKECHVSGINFVSLYKDTGHMSMAERPDMLMADLLTFCRYCYSHNPSAV